MINGLNIVIINYKYICNSYGYIIGLNLVIIWIWFRFGIGLDIVMF